MIEVVAPTATDTRAAAGRLASLCRAGDVIVLIGPLGAGKTAFVGGLADGLGVDERVASPSFVLMRRYDSGFLPLIHVDVYRVGSLLEFEDLEVLELGRDGVIVIEWGDAVASELPADRLEIRMAVNEDESRTLTFHGRGAWAGRPLSEVRG